MRPYLDMLADILNHGVRQGNRTGVDTLTLPGAMLKFNLKDGFPAVTTKKLAFKQVVGELIGFLRGYDNAGEFRGEGCTIWDQNANENKVWLDNPNRKGLDDLGRIYGVQWRNWVSDCTPGHYRTVDQIDVALETLRNNPQSRRIIVTAWNPGELDKMALPPCHLLFQLLPHVESKTLHLTMYQRSCDMFLGVPFNIASYALLLELLAAWSGYQAGTLTMFLADAHIYVNHVDQVMEQLKCDPMALPRLKIDHNQKSEDLITLSLDSLLHDLFPSDMTLVDYQHHPALTAPMAV